MSGTAFAGKLPADTDKLIHAITQQGRGWNFSAQVYNTSGQIIRIDNCFGFMFTNVGDVIATVNGMVVFPSATPLTALGDSRSLSGHLMDLFKGSISLSFQNPTAGVNPSVEIVQFYYIPGLFDLVEC